MGAFILPNVNLGTRNPCTVPTRSCPSLESPRGRCLGRGWIEPEADGKRWSGLQLLGSCFIISFPKWSADTVNYHFKVASFTLSYLLKSNHSSPHPSVQRRTGKRSRKIAEIIKGCLFLCERSVSSWGCDGCPWVIRKSLSWQESSLAQQQHPLPADTILKTDTTSFNHRTQYRQMVEHREWSLKLGWCVCLGEHRLQQGCTYVCAFPLHKCEWEGCHRSDHINVIKCT